MSLLHSFFLKIFNPFFIIELACPQGGIVVADRQDNYTNPVVSSTSESGYASKSVEMGGLLGVTTNEGARNTQSIAYCLPMRQKRKVVYVDTTLSFSANRLQTFLKAGGNKGDGGGVDGLEDMAVDLDLKVLFDLYGVLDVLTGLCRQLEGGNGVFLFLFSVDSCVFLFFGLVEVTAAVSEFSDEGSQELKPSVSLVILDSVSAVCASWVGPRESQGNEKTVVLFAV
jgi:hypothetical protein